MSEKPNQSAYRQVFKATGVFGGAQVFVILINILRSKVIALLLGAVGFGINSLFNAPMLLISSISSLGLPFSAVRDISFAHHKADDVATAKIVLSFRRLIWITSIVGAFVMAGASPILSKWTFGSYDKTFDFILLSLAVFFFGISSAQSSLLRGVRHIKEAALSTVLGSFFGLAVSIPVYYFFGNNGIVAALVVGTFSTMVVTYYFSSKLEFCKVDLSWKESFKLGFDMVKIGILITLSTIVTQIAGWGIYLFVSKFGGIAQVGLYSAGWAMTNQYAGMVFSAMGSDYLPRLSSVKDDNNKMIEMVNQQSEIALLILCPAMILFLAVLPIGIRILFSEEFLGIIVFVQWMLLGMSLKAVSWCLGFLVLAKGDSKTFMFTEVGIKFVSVPAYLGGYYIFGLEGIGIAFCVVYLLYTLFMTYICRRCYGFKYTYSNLKIAFVSIFMMAVMFAFVYAYGFPIAYISGGVMFVIAAIFSLRELEKRIGIKDTLRKIKSRFA